MAETQDKHALHTAEGGRLLKQISDHMEFLGYSVELSSSNTLIARSPTKFNVRVRWFRGGFLFQSLVAMDKGHIENDLVAYLEMINKLNAQAGLLRFYDDEHSSLYCECWHPGIYDKPKFGDFMEKFNADLQGLLFEKVKDIDKFTKD